MSSPTPPGRPKGRPRGLAGLVKDKRVLYVAGVGGAVGLYSLYQRRKGGAGASAATLGTGTTQYAAPSTLDTTPQDVASALGNFGGQLQNELSAYQQQLTGAIGQLQQMSQPPQPSPTPTPTPTPGPDAPRYQQVLAGWHVDQWIRDLQSGFGPAGGNPSITYPQLVALNPGVFNADISWKSSPSNNNNTELNVFKNSATFRIA